VTRYQDRWMFYRFEMGLFILKSRKMRFQKLETIQMHSCFMMFLILSPMLRARRLRKLHLSCTFMRLVCLFGQGLSLISSDAHGLMRRFILSLSPLWQRSGSVKLSAGF